MQTFFLTHWPLENWKENFRHAIFKQILVIDGWGISCEIVLIWMSLDFTDDQSTLVQVMALCRQATSHNLGLCWPRSLLAYGVTRPQWDKYLTSCTNMIITSVFLVYHWFSRFVDIFNLHSNVTELYWQVQILLQVITGTLQTILIFIKAMITIILLHQSHYHSYLVAKGALKSPGLEFQTVDWVSYLTSTKYVSEWKVYGWSY